jgi:hypothetical protein
MGFIYESRSSDSPYLETITRGWTEGEGSAIHPAETCWHMVFVKWNGRVHSLVVGPLTTAGTVPYSAGAEILWVKFKLGSFMPHLPVRDILNVETTLPGAAGRSFWLHGSAWQIPDFENIETFIDRLVQAGALVQDPVVNAALGDHLPEIPSRTVRHRFLRATGLTRSHIRQVERAQRAAELLRQGVSILDTVFEAGYFDQPHLTRALKQWIGHTPAQLTRVSGFQGG